MAGLDKVALDGLHAQLARHGLVADGTGFSESGEIVLYVREANDEELSASVFVGEGVNGTSLWPGDPPPREPCDVSRWSTKPHLGFWRRPTGGWVCETCHPTHLENPGMWVVRLGSSEL
jgi:hypothetical protein